MCVLSLIKFSVHKFLNYFSDFMIPPHLLKRFADLTQLEKALKMEQRRGDKLEAMYRCSEETLATNRAIWKRQYDLLQGEVSYLRQGLAAFACGPNNIYGRNPYETGSPRLQPHIPNSNDSMLSDLDLPEHIEALNKLFNPNLSSDNEPEDSEEEREEIIEDSGEETERMLDEESVDEYAVAGEF